MVCTHICAYSMQYTIHYQLIPIPACGRLTAATVCGLASGTGLVTEVEETDKPSGDFVGVASDELTPFGALGLVVGEEVIKGGVALSFSFSTA